MDSGTTWHGWEGRIWAGMGLVAGRFLQGLLGGSRDSGRADLLVDGWLKGWESRLVGFGWSHGSLNRLYPNELSYTKRRLVRTEPSAPIGATSHVDELRANTEQELVKVGNLQLVGGTALSLLEVR